jgi:hypothetical protein
LVHGDTIGITPVISENVLGQADVNPTNGVGTVCMLPEKYKGNIKLADKVFYNALAGSYLSQINIVVCKAIDILIIEN